MAKKHKYPLQDVDEPNLYREDFPYTDLPRVRFDGKAVPMQRAKAITVDARIPFRARGSETCMNVSNMEYPRDRDTNSIRGSM